MKKGKNVKKLASGSGDRAADQKKVGAGKCRYGMECRRKDCKFDHPSDAESQVQNEIEEDEFQDANTEQANQNDGNRENTHANEKDVSHQSA